jgi:hypothetical protein
LSHLVSDPFPPPWFYPLYCSEKYHCINITH